MFLEKWWHPATIFQCAKPRSRQHITALPTLISRLRLLLRLSLHSHSLVSLKHILSRRCGPKRRRQAYVSCNRERKNKGKKRGREERAQDRVLDGETSLPIQARLKVTTATNSTAHAHQSPVAPSSAFIALACARFIQAHFVPPMRDKTSQAGNVICNIFGADLLLNLVILNDDKLLKTRIIDSRYFVNTVLISWENI